MFMFKSKQRWSKRRLWCGRHLPDNPIAVFFFGGNCLYNFCQYPIHTKILCKKWRWCVEANLRGLCLCGIGILAIPHQNTSHKRSCYFKNINVVYIQYDTVSEVSKLHLETSLRRIWHCTPAFLKTPYTPLPYMFWKLWTCSFTWNRPIYDIHVQKIDGDAILRPQ